MSSAAATQAKKVARAEALARAIFETGEAWVTSIPGADKQLRIEILPGSPLVDVLSEQYKMTRGGQSERWLHSTIESKLIDSKGKFVGKTTGADLVTVDVYFLELPK